MVIKRIMMDFDKVYFDRDVTLLGIYRILVYMQEISRQSFATISIYRDPNIGEDSRCVGKESIEPISAFPVSCQF